MKQNKIKGGVYRGWWFEFYTNKEAKKIAHKQERKRSKALVYKNKEV